MLSKIAGYLVRGRYLAMGTYMVFLKTLRRVPASGGGASLAPLQETFPVLKRRVWGGLPDGGHLFWESVCDRNPSFSPNDAVNTNTSKA